MRPVKREEAWQTRGGIMSQSLAMRDGGFFVLGENEAFERFDCLTMDRRLRRVQREVNDSLPDKECGEGMR